MLIEITNKEAENIQFEQKLAKLEMDVRQKATIVDLDNPMDDYNDDDYEDVKDKESDNYAGYKVNKKYKDLADVTKMKNLIQSYYEEIEYLRSELDKLRARTFPSFLQKPDQIIYPDEK